METCLILLPQGCHRTSSGRSVDFDALYSECIAPAVAQSGVRVVRPNLDIEGRILNAPRLQLLSSAAVCIADMSLLDPLVTYQIGVRHALKAGGTVLMYADAATLPIANVNDTACVYRLGDDGKVADLASVRDSLSHRIRACLEGRDDSPVSVLGDVATVDDAAIQAREALVAQWAEAQSEDGDRLDTLLSFEAALLPCIVQHLDLAFELLMEYRGCEAWSEMASFFQRLPDVLRALPRLQEQYALALNRSGETAQAENALRRLLNQQGGAGDTYGVLGRIFKDQWEAARFSNQDTLAAGFLDKAIDAYLKGFEADWRDPYAGINAVTLMEIREPPDPRREALLPVVIFAARQRIRSGTTDYWDFATLLEAAILAKDKDTASSVLVDAVGASVEGWEPKSTARNLRLIREARERRKDRRLKWAEEVEDTLEQRGDAL